MAWVVLTRKDQLYLLVRSLEMLFHKCSKSNSQIELDDINQITVTGSHQQPSKDPPVSSLPIPYPAFLSALLAKHASAKPPGIKAGSVSGVFHHLPWMGWLGAGKGERLRGLSPARD